MQIGQFPRSHTSDPILSSRCLLTPALAIDSAINVSCGGHKLPLSPMVGRTLSHNDRTVTLRTQFSSLGHCCTVKVKMRSSSKVMVRKPTPFEGVISDLTHLESAMDKEMFALYKTGLPVVVVRISLLHEVEMSHNESCRPSPLDFWSWILKNTVAEFLPAARI